MEDQSASENYPRLVRHFDRAQQLSKTGSWEWDIITDDILWSPEVYRIFGLSPETTSPSYPAFLEQVHPEDRQRLEEAVARAIAEDGHYSLDHRILLPDGDCRLVHEDGAVERDPEGRAIRMVGAVQDVTRLRAMEASTRQSQELLASLMRISPEAVVVAGADRRIILISAGAEDMFGYSNDEAVGLGIEQLMPMRFRSRHQGHVDGFIAGEVQSLRMHQRSEITALRRDGEEFPAEASLTKLLSPDGWIFTAIIRDLTERRRTEQVLIEARELAERANLAKSLFLANMSHEIRTPLNGILGLAGVLGQSRLEPRDAEMVQLIETSGRALLSLLNDILDLAKVDAGRMALRDEPFDLWGMIEDTVALFRASVAQKNVRLTLEVSHHARAQYAGDELRIRQVLSNLLSNAVKFTEQGDIRVAVSEPPCGPGSCIIRFAVSDTGIGFAPELAETLFERFEQADSSSTRAFSGTGLGLSISKSLVQLMGGAITASSTPGKGSTFEFEIPLRRSLRDEFTEPPPPAVEGRAHLPAVRVLLAEDHPINRRTVELMLEALPVNLTCVVNGQEAVNATASSDFDLILMDLQMPVMGGIEAIRLIRKREGERGGRPTPICVLSANALSDQQQDAEQAGADRFLAKPIDVRALIAVVADLAMQGVGQPP